MGCRKLLFQEAEPNREKSADSPSPARLDMNDMNVAVDVQHSEVPERSPCGSEPSKLGGRGTMDSCINVPETACRDGRSEGQTVGTRSQGVVFSPPATLNAIQMNASEEELPPQTQKESMDSVLIPREGMSFHSEVEAKEFFMRYAQLAGFGALRVRNKTTMKMKCNAHLKFTRVYDNEGNKVDMVIEKINLFHNHMLHTPLKTKQMRSHKITEPILYRIIDELQVAGVSTQSIKNVLHARRVELVLITARDIENM
ncbi:hypothetical protein SETIT_9G312500v2 [Setaria italica]|uniref:FAR1 domain-containing protein n=1 Tax=Setaria italica TaxID=4555 RepID=A0A368SMU5_SETIT|nr:hypothetical protein SETIT_9G312500v2 [Setaria italica]